MVEVYLWALASVAAVGLLISAWEAGTCRQMADFARASEWRLVSCGFAISFGLFACLASSA